MTNDVRVDRFKLASQHEGKRYTLLELLNHVVRNYCWSQLQKAKLRRLRTKPFIPLLSTRFECFQLAAFHCES
jgi:hypothetical protein